VDVLIAGLRHAKRALVRSFAATLLAFFAVMTFVQLYSREIGQLAVAVSQDAVPGVEHLSVPRSEVRRVEMLSTALVLRASDGQNFDPEPLRQSVARLERHVDSFQPLVSDSSEARAWELARLRMDELRDTSEQISDATRSGQLRRGRELALGELRERAERASDALVDIQTLNTTMARNQAHAIYRLWKRSTPTAYALCAAAALLTLWAAFSAWRTIKLFAQVLDLRRQQSEERARELEQFAGRIAHDLSNPLAAAMLGLRLAGDTAQPGSVAARRIERTVNSLNRLNEMIEGLLDFARSGAHPRTDAAIAVRNVVEGVIDDSRAGAEAAGVAFESDVPADVRVACSPGALASVLSNLVRNAVLYMDETANRRIRVRARQDGDVARIEVEDTGPGIAAMSQDAVFAPYVRGTTRGTGLGLGLATVKRLVEAHRGELTLKSPVAGGRGTLFIIELPSMPAALAQVASGQLQLEHAS
jgi:signal transduction histidine kinase